MVKIIIETADECGDRRAVTTSGNHVGCMRKSFDWQGIGRYYAMVGFAEKQLDLGRVYTKQQAASTIGEFLDEQIQMLENIEKKIEDVSSAIELLHHAPTASSILEEGLNQLQLKRLSYQYFVELIKDEEAPTDGN